MADETGIGQCAAGVEQHADGACTSRCDVTVGVGGAAATACAADDRGIVYQCAAGRIDSDATVAAAAGAPTVAACAARSAGATENRRVVDQQAGGEVHTGSACPTGPAGIAGHHRVYRRTAAAAS